LQVDLIDDGNNLQAVIDGEIGIRERLCFDALRCVNNQQRTFAGRQRPRDFIGKVDVAGRIDQIKLINLSVLRRV